MNEDLLILIQQERKVGSNESFGHMIKGFNAEQISEVDDRGATYLHHIAKYGSPSMLKKFTKRCNELNVNLSGVQDNFGNIPLHYIGKRSMHVNGEFKDLNNKFNKNNCQMYDALYGYTSKDALSVKNHDNYTALEHLIIFCDSVAALANDHFIESIITDMSFSDKTFHALRGGVGAGKFAKMIEEFDFHVDEKTNKAYLKHKNDENKEFTEREHRDASLVVSFAIATNNPDIVDILLQKNPDIDKSKSVDRTMLEKAVVWKKNNVVQFLLSKEAQDVKPVQTLCYVARWNLMDSDQLLNKLEQFEFGVDKDTKEPYVKLKTDSGSTVTQKDKSNAEKVISAIIRSDNPTYMEKLLQHKPELAKCKVHDQKLLEFAYKKGMYKIAEQLIRIDLSSRADQSPQKAKRHDPTRDSNKGMSRS